VIKKILIKNFQTHERRRIDLSPTITTIVGKSDVGKSAIYRAIRWIATGLPKGNDFIRWGEKNASVALEVDGHKVIRKKGISNLYKLDGEEYKALRTDVPEEVKSILNLDTINFQSQHDAPFWFSETAGEISRQLNAIVNLSLIDTSIKKAISKSRENKTLTTYLATQVEENKKDVEVLGFVLPLQELLKKLEKATAKEEKLSLKRDTLEIDFNQALRKKKAIKELQPILNKEKPLQDSFEKAESLETKANDLSNLIWRIEENEEVLGLPIPSVDKLNETMFNIESLRKRMHEIKTTIVTYETKKTNLERESSILIQLEKQLTDEFKGRCPLCGNPV